MSEPDTLRGHGDQALLPQPIKRQAIAATHTGLLENVLEMDLDGSRPDSKLLRDLFVLGALFHELQYLLLAGRQRRPRVTVRANSIAEDRILHPVPARRHHVDAAHEGTKVSALADDS